MRTFVRIGRSGRSACRSRRLLRVGRAAGRPAAARPPRHRRRGRRARGELRGEGVRRQDSHERRAGAASVSPRSRRPAPHVRLLGGEQGRVPRLRGHDAGRRGAVDRRGVPRRSRHGAALGLTARDRRPPASGRARARRPAHHGRRGEDEVPGQGRERRRQAGRPARRAPGPGAGVPAPAPGRAALGRGAGHGGEAPATRDHDRPRGGRARRRRADRDPRTGVRQAPPRARPQPRSPPRAGGPPAALDGAHSTPSAAALRRRPTPWTLSSWPSSTSSPAACVRHVASAGP